MEAVQLTALPAPASVPLERPARVGWDEFETLVRRHHQDLRRFAHRLLADAHHTEDVLQESYLKAYRAFTKRNGRGGAAEAAWLFRIVYRSCLDELRRQRRKPVRALHEVPADAHARAGHERRVLQRAALAQALAGLSPQARATVLLVDGQGFDYAEAAEILRVPRGTIASRLNRARAELRRVLEEA